MRNGASLAADPTLTGVWSLPKQEALRLAFQRRSRSGSEEPGRRAAYHRPALAPAPVPSVTGTDPKTCSGRLAVPRPSSRPMPQAVPLRPQAPLNLSTGRQVRPVRLCALGASTVRDPVCFRTSPDARLVSFLDLAAFAVASIRFRNPLFRAGLSTFASEGPIPVSMSGRCAAEAIRASARACTYPLSTTMPVDKAG